MNESAHRRGDIQGLRAVAVIAVVLAHTFRWPASGFIGVDVFYVISGFVITSSLAREYRRSGEISFRHFYARRMRRLAPVAFAGILATSTAAIILWYPPRAIQTLLDAAAAALSIENWHLIAVGSNYLQATTSPSPLQHYWSLSIEEQFYTAWPSVVLVILTMASSGSAWRRRLPLVAVSTLMFVSLGWCAYRTLSNPSAAYYDSFGRGWELLLGAALALMPRAARFGSTARGVVASAGVAILVAASLLITPPVSFPWPVALVPTLGAALVIHADAGQWGLLRLLTSRPAQYIGRISYSVYIWHFPIVIVVGSAIGDGLLPRIAEFAALAGVSVLSYRFIERQFLSGAMPASKEVQGSRSKMFWPLLALAGIATLAVMQTSAGLGAADDVSRPRVETVLSFLRTPTAAVLRMEASKALGRDGYPATVRAQLATVGVNDAAQALSTRSPGCRNSVTSSAVLVCRYPAMSTHPRILVIGDSVALSWVPTVRSAFPSTAVEAVGYADCPPVDIDVHPQAERSGFAGRCASARAKMVAQVRVDRPDLLILSAAEGYAGALDRLNSHTSAMATWRLGQAGFLRRVAPYAIAIIVLGNPPSGGDPKTCASLVSRPAACVARISAWSREKQVAEQQAVLSVHHAGTTLKSVAVADWMCARSTCPAFLNRTLLRFDTTHLRAQGAQLFARALRDAIMGDPPGRDDSLLAQRQHVLTRRPLDGVL